MYNVLWRNARKVHELAAKKRSLVPIRIFSNEQPTMDGCGLQWTVADGLVDHPLVLASSFRQSIARWPRNPPESEAQCHISAKLGEKNEDPRGHTPDHHLIGPITSDVHHSARRVHRCSFAFFSMAVRIGPCFSLVPVKP